MKKLILATFASVAIALTGYSQGTVTIANSTSTWFISTNNGTIGIIGGTSTSFFFTVLTTAYTGTAPSTSYASLINSSIWTWTQVTGDKNSLNAGSIAGAFGQAATGWPLPSTSNYSDGPTNYYVIIGWSSQMGANWLAVSNDIATLTFAAGSLFGTSAVAFQVAGGANSLNPAVLWGDGTGIPGAGLASGFQLTPVPEPASIALMGLGGLSLLLFRRKK